MGGGGVISALKTSRKLRKLLKLRELWNWELWKKMKASFPPLPFDLKNLQSKYAEMGNYAAENSCKSSKSVEEKSGKYAKYVPYGQKGKPDHTFPHPLHPEHCSSRNNEWLNDEDPQQKKLSKLKHVALQKRRSTASNFTCSKYSPYLCWASLYFVIISSAFRVVRKC